MALKLGSTAEILDIAADSKEYCDYWVVNLVAIYLDCEAWRMCVIRTVVEQVESSGLGSGVV